MNEQSLVILGSTGSIGKSTLDVVDLHNDSISVYALSAYSRMQDLAQQSMKYKPRVVVVPNDMARQRFIESWNNSNTPMPEVRVGAQSLCDTVAEPEVTTVMAAIVGAAGLPATLAAVEAGKRVLLANKEALVAAGAIFMQAVRKNKAELLPIDSEHNAIFQCMPDRYKSSAPSVPANGIRRLLLTASGGPFLKTPIDDLNLVTPDQACAHPNWEMGKKISVDSATMINKGLEVIEAHWLFAMPTEKISVVIHPQSVVHSMVEYDDGSILAQLGQPDMRTPIAYGLGYPSRIKSGVGLMDITQLSALEFHDPDINRFPCLDLSFKALKEGQWACIALNAANEIAVHKFLHNEIKFTDISSLIEDTINAVCSRNNVSLNTLHDILHLDDMARRLATEFSTSCYSN